MADLNLLSVKMDGAAQLGARLNGILETLEGAGRDRMSKAMGTEVRGVIVKHLQKLGATRHATANRLGANPTGYAVELAENFDHYSEVEVKAGEVTIVMEHPRIARAYRDIPIVAKGKLLTIPVNALAYGHSAREFAKVHFIKKGGAKGKTPTGKARKINLDLPTYVLVESVVQRQDRTLMPTSAELTAGAARGARSVLRGIRRGGAK